MSAERAAILVSPAPIDGYPPVQHQSRLLAEAGFAVEVVTTAAAWKAGAPDFRHPGVAVRIVNPVGRGPIAAATRNARFLAVIAAARRRLGGPALVEIAYEPLGILLSDCAPHRPGLRVAHLHECLQRFDTAWVERRLGAALASYDRIVVADQARGESLQRQIALREEPLVIPNYPMRSAAPPRQPRDHGFEVIYCGAIGMLQKLDVIVSSVVGWPEHAVLTLIGNDRTDIGAELKHLVSSLGVQSRVKFEGWIPYDRLAERLAQADLGISLLDPSYEQWRTALGASNKRYQYMQAGLPQIGDMNPGIAALIEGQDIGRCLASFNPRELASVIRDYVAQPQLRAAQGRRAQELHLSHYNYHAAFAPMLEWLLTGDARQKAAA